MKFGGEASFCSEMVPLKSFCTDVTHASNVRTPGGGNGHFAARRPAKPVSLRWSISSIETFALDGHVHPTHSLHANTAQ